MKPQSIDTAANPSPPGLKTPKSPARGSRPLRKPTVALLTALSALLLSSAAMRAQMAEPSVEIWTPRDWQTKLVNTTRDLNQNFVEDSLDAMNADAQVSVILALNDCPSQEDLTRFSQFGKIGYVGRTLSVVCLKDVRQKDLQRLGQDPKVAMVEHDAPIHATLNVSTRHIRARGGSPLYSPNTVEDAYGLTGASVNVAVLDSGVDDGLHESLPAAKFVGGFDAFTMTEGNPDDDNGHGTHVAGIILGTGGPAGTHRGVAPGSGLIDIKVLDAAGNGTVGGAIAGLDRCVLRRTTWNIGVANLSLGSCAPSNGSDSLSQAVNRAVMANIVVVVAMGNTPNCGMPNNFSSVNPPASADDGIAVAASDDHNQVNRTLASYAPYSFTGPRAGDGDADSTDEQKPDVTAPGTSIQSALFDSTNGYFPLDGTSQAAPHVAGLAALIREAAPGMLPLSVRQLIRDTAEDRGAPGWDSFWGHGLIDAFAAIDRYRTTSLNDLRFDQNCNSPDPMNWASADLFAVSPSISEGVANTIQANIRNNGLNTSSPAQVRIGVYGFSNGDLNYHICTVPLPAIAPGAVYSVTCPWTPSITGLPPGVVHACLKAEIITPFDSDFSNNCAQHNIDIQQTASPAHFRARLVNTTGKRIHVRLLHDLPADSRWVLEPSGFETQMEPDGCPMTLDLNLIPRDGHAQGRQQVNIGIVGFAEDAPNIPIRMGGFSIQGVARVENQRPSGKPDAYAYLPGQTLTIGAPGVLANDTDPNPGNELTPVLTASAEHGQVNLLADGSLTYTPDPDFSGPDRFVYEVSDGWARSFPVVVALNPIVRPTITWQHAQGSTNLTLTWIDPNGTFEVYCSPEVSPTRWEKVTLPIQRQNGRGTIIIPIDQGTPRRFYRLLSPDNAEGAMPVFDIQGNALTDGAISVLSAVFGVPKELLLIDEGAARYADPERFQQIPQQVVNDPALLQELLQGSEPGPSDIVVRSIDFGALAKLQAIEPAVARVRLQAGLNEARLVPTEGQMLTSYSKFEAVDLKGRALIQPTAIDTTVSYQLSLAGYPLVGPGANISATFSPDNKLTAFSFANRQTRAGSRKVRVFSPQDAAVKAGITRPGVTADARLVYYAPPVALGSVSTLIPHYDVGGVAQVNGHTLQLLRRLIPATDDPEFVPDVKVTAEIQNGSVHAKSEVSGGKAPYRFRWTSSSSDLEDVPEDVREVNYRIAVREGSILRQEVVSVTVTDANGVEVRAESRLTDLSRATIQRISRAGVGLASLKQADYGLERAVSDLCAGQQIDFRNRFNADGIPRDFDFTGSMCWERDFLQGGTGLDHLFVDDADLVFYMGHGWPDGFTFESSQSDGDVVFNQVTGAWGNRDLEWLSLLSCQVLADSSGSGAWWQRWGPAFDGLHQIEGFHTVAYDQGGFGGAYADWMLGKRILFLRLPPQPIRSAWFLAKQSNQPSSVVAAVIGALGPGGIACYDDYFWGRGPVGPDLRGANLRGWWRVTR